MRLIADALFGILRIIVDNLIVEESFENNTASITSVLSVAIMTALGGLAEVLKLAR